VLASHLNDVTQQLPDAYLQDPPRILHDEEYGHLSDDQLGLLRSINRSLVEVSPAVFVAGFSSVTFLHFSLNRTSLSAARCFLQE
jgi:hypothetical protein